jgi:hypothetical protein
VREIRTLRSTWRGLETWYGRDAVTPRNRKGEATVNTNFDLNRRASLRPYLGAPGGEIPPGDSTISGMGSTRSARPQPVSIPAIPDAFDATQESFRDVPCVTKALSE